MVCQIVLHVASVFIYDFGINYFIIMTQIDKNRKISFFTSENVKRMILSLFVGI